jgi:hypothetical protein
MHDDLLVGSRAILEIDRGQVELADAPHRGERDRQVLNGETGRVEDRRLFVVTPSFSLACEHVAELRHVVARDASGVDGVCEIAVV